jgi:hypothetical protein
MSELLVLFRSRSQPPGRVTATTPNLTPLRPSPLNISHMSTPRPATAAAPDNIPSSDTSRPSSRKRKSHEPPKRSEEHEVIVISDSEAGDSNNGGGGVGAARRAPRKKSRKLSSASSDSIQIIDLEAEESEIALLKQRLRKVEKARLLVFFCMK